MIARFWLLLCFLVGIPALRAAERPNILWIIVEDMSADFSCYGETAISTPNVDQLAQEGALFRRAFTTAPICSISRSALITGYYQTSIGCQNHRSSVPGHEITLPEGVETIPALMKKAGYHTNNLTLEDFLTPWEETAASNQKSHNHVAKTDYNFEWDRAATYDSTHWSARKTGQPFFVQVQLHGGKFRGQAPNEKWPNRVKQVLGSVTPPESVKLPPYLPDDPVIRADWAHYLDTVRMTDHEVGRIVDKLSKTGDLARTVIIFLTDHGISHVRNKQFLYDAGTHIPLIIRGPGITAGQVREDLVEHIDISATTLALGGVPIPPGMHGRDLLAKNHIKRTHIFAARDRADETVDFIRSVRTEKFKYIRNGYPSRPYLQPNRYKDDKAIVQTMRKLYQDGKLTAAQAKIMAPTRPKEELYDLETDPFELNNLANQNAHAATLEELRKTLTEWQERTNDQGRTPESEEIYKIETGSTHAEGGKNADNPIYRANADLMLRWAKEKPYEP